jgi:DNA-directed RNA polymerase specialized sigma24 family protein
MTSRSAKVDVAALYAEHSEGILMFLARRTGEPDVALDLWSETFARALQKQRSYRGATPEEAAGWLYSIARNSNGRLPRRRSWPASNGAPPWPTCARPSRRRSPS